MPHPTFVRHGNDIDVTMETPISLMVLGGSLEVPTPQGNKTIKIRPGMQNGIKVRIKELGFPVLNHPSQRGDLYAILQVKVPTNEELTDDVKELFKKLQEAGF